jgi:hypothetical protein
MRSNQNSPKKPAAPAAKSVPKKTPATVKPTAKVSGPPDKQPVPKPTRAPVKPTLKDPVPAPPRKLGPNPQSVTKPAQPPKKAPARPVPIPPKATVAGEAKPARPAPIPPKTTGADQGTPARPSQTRAQLPEKTTTPTRAKTAPKRSITTEIISEPENVIEPDPPEPEEETNSLQQPKNSTKKSSNLISWKQVARNVFRFYFCLCLPEQP